MTTQNWIIRWTCGVSLLLLVIAMLRSEDHLQRMVVLAFGITYILVLGFGYLLITCGPWEEQ